MKITKDELTLVNNDALSKFYSGIKSQATRKDYDKILKRVLCDILEDVLEGDYSQRANQICAKAKAEPLWIDSLLNALAIKLKKRTELPKTDKTYLNPRTVPNYFHPIKKLFVMNDVLFNWNKLFSTYPELDNANDDTRGYTHKEIQTMLQFANGIMDRAIILVLASSGIRKGAFKTLDWEDLQPVYKNDGDEFVFDVLESESNSKPVCALLRIYKKTPNQYSAMITPEAYQALMEYKKSWFAQMGREPKPTDPIFKQVGIPAVRRLDDIGIQSRIKAIVKRSGISKPLAKGQRLHEIPIMNGFRRFFNKNNKKSRSKGTLLSTLINKELMMGHQGMIPLDKNYYHEVIVELIEDYLQAVPNLTIDEAESLKLEKEKQKRTISELEAKNAEIEKIKADLAELNELKEKAARLTERLERQESITGELQLISSKINEVLNRESNPYNPHFPDAGPFDTRMINLEVSEINDKSIVLFDTEFEERIDVVLKEDKIYCKRDRSSNCKHVLFALGNPEFYQRVKKNNIGLTFLTVSSRTKKM